MSGSSFSSPINGLVSLPPQASINPSPLRRRQSDYVDQSQEALSSMPSRPPIDYPELSAQHILRPPPAVASSSLERQDNRPRMVSQAGPRPPTIPSDYPVTYWADIQIGTSGLKNLGNTCYMNSTIQCLSATVPFARFFTGTYQVNLNS
jgi:ubiquitin carboxyl-terminal hydrolase 8